MKGESSILISGTLFGTVGLFIKWAMAGTTPADLLFFRFAIAAIVGLCILLSIERGKSFKLNKQELFSFFILGILTIISMGLFVFSLSYTSIANSILLIYLFPTTTAFFAMHFLHERITRFTWFALAISLVGVVILVYNDFMFG